MKLYEFGNLSVVMYLLRNKQYELAENICEVAIRDLKKADPEYKNNIICKEGERVFRYWTFARERFCEDFQKNWPKMYDDSKKILTKVS